MEEMENNWKIWTNVHAEHIEEPEENLTLKGIEHGIGYLLEMLLSRHNLSLNCNRLSLYL